MRRKYPKAEKMKFLICDQVRPEINKKISIMGLYPGDHIVFFPKVIGQFPYTLASLSFVFVFGDGVGEFDAGFEMIDPAGNPVQKVSLNPIILTAEGTGGVVVNINSVQFNAEGDYFAAVHIGNKRYDFPFRVSSSDAPMPK